MAILLANTRTVKADTWDKSKAFGHVTFCDVDTVSKPSGYGIRWPALVELAYFDSFDQWPPTRASERRRVLM